MVSGTEKDGPSPTAPARQFHVSLSKDPARHELGRLRAPEHEGRPVDLAPHHDATRLRPEGLDVEEGLRRGQPQDAAARYGSHRGSTSDRWRSRHRWPFGGAGLMRNVHPSSDRSWSPLWRLSRLQAATTFDQS